MKRLALISSAAALAFALSAVAADAQKHRRGGTDSQSAPQATAAPRERVPAAGHQRAPEGNQRDRGSSERAVPRADAPRSEPASEGSREPRRAPQATAREGGSRGRVPDYSRPRGDNRPTGRAVPRAGVPTRPSQRALRYPGGYVPGYGAFGLGYFFYDPYWWGYPGYGYSAYGYPYGYQGYGYQGYGSGYAYPDTGGLRLKVKPREAQVFVDGYYIGVVNSFDGVFQRLSLDRGPHRIEIRANGYESLVFEVRIVPGETITYKGELRRQ